MRNIPIVTKNLLIVNIVAFLITYILGKDASGGYVLHDLLGLHFFMASDFHVYQILTYLFMHGGIFHIVMNMFMLWMFGAIVERVWGAKKFLFYYIVCGIGAGLFQEVVQFFELYQLNASTYSMLDFFRVASENASRLNGYTTVGASGAVYGVLLAFGMIYPNERIFVIPIPIPIKAKYLVIGCALIELYSSYSSTEDGIAHIAHLGGMVFGFFMIRYWRKQTNGYGGSSARDAFEKLRDALGGKRNRQHFNYTRNHNPQSDSNSYQSHQQDWDYNAHKRATQEEIDRILDKIRKSGYDSLTKDEKQTLFDQSKK